MSNVAIIGFGVLGKQILNFIKESSVVSKVIVFDDFSKDDSLVDLVLPMKRWIEQEFQQFHFYIGIGYRHLTFRRDLLSKLKELKRSNPPLIHPASYISPFASLGDGCLFFPHCNIDQNVQIGSGNIFHNSVTISHDCIIGECNYFSPSVTLCGNVKIGKENFIGAGTTVSNGISVGDNVKVGIGSCITKNIPSNLSVIGNPLKILNNQLNLP